jgi:hypothetical protein
LAPDAIRWEKNKNSKHKLPTRSGLNVLKILLEFNPYRGWGFYLLKIFFDPPDYIRGKYPKRDKIPAYRTGRPSGLLDKWMSTWIVSKFIIPKKNLTIEKI